MGLLTLVAIGGAVWATLRTDDRPGSVRGYELSAVFDSAQGVYVSTQVRIAGVAVGSVRGISLDEGGARLELELEGGVTIPEDSVAELKGEGVLGDRYVRITPGTSDVALAPGGRLRTSGGGTDLDALQQKVDAIATDVQAITGALRATIEQDRPQEQVGRVLENVEIITAQLALMTAANRQDVDAIADNVRRLTEVLADLAVVLGDESKGELAQIRQATEKLDRSLAHVESVAAKIDAGEGTLGRLVNDDAAMAQIEDTLADVGEVVDGITGLHTEVYYRGSQFFGTQPQDPAFDNPVAGNARNIIGLRLMPREDYWYVFEFVDHPVGEVTYTEHYLPETGTRWTEYTRTPDYRFSLQFAKRYHGLVARLGIKESAGGVGLDYLAFRDRFMLSADLYDFDFGSWPWLDGTPNLQVGARVTPYPHLYLEGGLDNVLLGLRHGYTTGFVGGGITFTDDDFKWLLATLPLPG